MGRVRDALRSSGQDVVPGGAGDAGVLVAYGPDA